LAFVLHRSTCPCSPVLNVVQRLTFIHFSPPLLVSSLDDALRACHRWMNSPQHATSSDGNPHVGVIDFRGPLTGVPWNRFPRVSHFSNAVWRVR
jgi:hypothetical protein